jgi:hypothetical protein
MVQVGEKSGSFIISNGKDGCAPEIWHGKHIKLTIRRHNVVLQAWRGEERDASMMQCSRERLSRTQEQRCGVTKNDPGQPISLLVRGRLVEAATVRLPTLFCFSVRAGNNNEWYIVYNETPQRSKAL